MSTIVFEFISAMSGMSGLGQEQKLQQRTQGRDGGGHGRGAGKRGQNEEQVLGKGRQLLAGRTSWSAACCAAVVCADVCVQHGKAGLGGHHVHPGYAPPKAPGQAHTG